MRPGKGCATQGLDVEGVVEDAGVAADRGQGGCVVERGVAFDLVILRCGKPERAPAPRGIRRQRHQFVDERGARRPQRGEAQGVQPKWWTVTSGPLGLRRRQQHDHERTGYR